MTLEGEIEMSSTTTVYLDLVKGQETAQIYMDRNGLDYEGLELVANSFVNDVQLITNKTLKMSSDFNQLAGTVLIIGTVGNNALIDQFVREKKLDVTDIQGKWEVFKIAYIEQPLAGIDHAVVIVGSDKRGAIYGTYHLSGLIGISPWVYWADVAPAKKEDLSIEISQLNIVSKEPSVKYRGIFLNDEWPSLGNWVNNQFDGFNELFYGKVFELILRLKGNYLWPAMWSAIFSEDGQHNKLANAELAHKYGIVIGTSHHEPMCRSGEEWSKTYEQYTQKYDWDFRVNREAILKFWEDGVERNKNFNNIITLGMRGERDSSLRLDLAENIELLKDIILAQKKILQEKELADAPKVLMVYKEVERCWHGNEEVEGLEKWNELEDVTIMLCDDNFGNVRTLPNAVDRDRKSGWGMYYHFDYHGGPRSYEWINSTQLERTWEQLTMAYEYGIQDIWIVNVGDLKPQELPISYFMDLAYDFDTYGKNGRNQTSAYIDKWVKQQFGEHVTVDKLEQISSILKDYTKMNSSCKPELLDQHTYSTEHYNEAEQILAKSFDLANRAYDDEGIPEAAKDAYYQLVGYPAVATANLHILHTSVAFNEKFANRENASSYTNWYAQIVDQAIEADQWLERKYNKEIADGKWNGMMSSPHIGFVSWNADGWQYPAAKYIALDKAGKMILDIEGCQQSYTTGEAMLPAFTSINNESYSLLISNGGSESFIYSISTNVDWLNVDSTMGSIEIGKQILVSVDWNKLQTDAQAELVINGAGQLIKLNVLAKWIDTNGLPDMTFIEHNGVVSIEAEHAAYISSTSKRQWQLIENYGKHLSALKVYPDVYEPLSINESPYVEYKVQINEPGEYTITLFTAPTNNLTTVVELKYGITVDDHQEVIVNSLAENFIAGHPNKGSWGRGVIENIHQSASVHKLEQGVHSIKIHSIDAGLVIQKLVLAKQELPHTWFGPPESYYVGSNRPTTRLVMQPEQYLSGLDYYMDMKNSK